MTTTTNSLLAAKDLQLGDTVRLTWMQASPAWSTAIVQQITETEVVLWRPYGTTADFSYTGGVICYMGSETIRVLLEFNRREEFELLARQDLK